MTDNELIPVTKHGEYLEVHPVAIAQHEALGWVKCARQERDDEPEGAKKATVAELREALAAKGIEIPEGAKKATVAELREALAAKGIEIPEGAKKADLQALLDAAQ